MKREKLFRGFDPNMKEWVYGSYLHTDTNINECLNRRPIREIHSIVCYFSGDWNMGGWSPVDVLPETVGQFTGLTDKNGTKIFEGDFVRADSDAVQKVEYRSDMAMFVLRFEKGASMNLISDCEVVGNIHDNPNIFVEQPTKK